MHSLKLISFIGFIKPKINTQSSFVFYNLHSVIKLEINKFLANYYNFTNTLNTDYFQIKYCKRFITTQINIKPVQNWTVNLENILQNKVNEALTSVLSHILSCFFFRRQKGYNAFIISTSLEGVYCKITVNCSITFVMKLVSLLQKTFYLCAFIEKRIYQHSNGSSNAKIVMMLRNNQKFEKSRIVVILKIFLVKIHNILLFLKEKIKKFFYIKTINLKILNIFKFFSFFFSILIFFLFFFNFYKSILFYNTKLIERKIQKQLLQINNMQCFFSWQAPILICLFFPTFVPFINKRCYYCTGSVFSQTCVGRQLFLQTYNEPLTYNYIGQLRLTIDNKIHVGTTNKLSVGIDNLSRTFINCSKSRNKVCSSQAAINEWNYSCFCFNLQTPEACSQCQLTSKFISACTGINRRPQLSMTTHYWCVYFSISETNRPLKKIGELVNRGLNQCQLTVGKLYFFEYLKLMLAQIKGKLKQQVKANLTKIKYIFLKLISYKTSFLHKVLWRWAKKKHPQCSCQYITNKYWIFIHKLARFYFFICQQPKKYS